MKGGASSASQITEVVTNTYGWNVTKPDVIDKEMWDRIYDVYVQDSYGLGTEQFFRQQNHLPCQAVTGSSHFDRVSRYPGNIHRGLPAAFTEARPYRYSIQHPRRKYGLRHAGRYRFL